MSRVSVYYSLGLDALERAVKTAAQTAVVTLGADKLDVFNVDWLDVVGLSGGAALLSLLTSLGSAALPFGGKGAATLAPDVAPAPVTATGADHLG